MKIICFEGLDGSGKSETIKGFVRYLNSINIKVITTREPGGCPEAEYLRDSLKQSKLCKKHVWSPTEQMLLMFTARMRSARELEDEAQEAGAQVMLLDRNFLSSYVYQVVGQDADRTLYHQLVGVYLADEGLIPDHTIILHNTQTTDLDTQIAMRDGELDTLDMLAIKKRKLLEATYANIQSTPTNGKVTHIPTNPTDYQNLFNEFKKTDVFKTIIKSLV